MPAAIGAAVAGAFFSAGTVAFAVTSIGTQLAVGYALNSLAAPKPQKAGGAANQAAKAIQQNITGGDTPEYVIYGRAKVGGCLFMAQNVTADDGTQYIYQGLTIGSCRHPLNAIEKILFDGKELDDPDWSDVEFSKWQIRFEGQFIDCAEISAGQQISANRHYCYLGTGSADGASNLIASSASTNSTTGNVLVLDDADYAEATDPYNLINANYIEIVSAGRYRVELSLSNPDADATVAQIIKNSAVVAASKFSAGQTSVIWEGGLGANDIIEFAINGEGNAGAVQIVVRQLSETAAAACQSGGDIVLTINDIAKTFTPTHLDTAKTARDFFVSEFNADDSPELDGVTLSAIDAPQNDAGVYLQIERADGSIENWDVSVTISNNPDNTGIGVNETKTAGHAEDGKRYRIVTELGTQTAANSTLVAELDKEGVPQRWNASCKLSGVPYCVVRWDRLWLRENMGRLPEVTFIVQGKSNIFDPRTNSTQYTTNAALCLRDYLTQQYGFAATATELPNNFWIAAANLCDEPVPTLAGTQARYAVNGVLDTGTQPGDALQLFANQMQAPIIWSGGAWMIEPAAYRTPNIELTADDLAGDVELTDRPSIQDRYNQIRGTFIYPDQEWQSIDYPPVTVDDGLPEQAGQISFAFEIDPERAQRLALLNLLMNYSSAPVRVPIKRLSQYIRAGSMIYFTLSELDWDREPFYVLSRDENEDTTAVLTLVKRTAAHYAWDKNNAQTLDTISATPLFKIREELK